MTLQGLLIGGAYTTPVSIAFDASHVDSSNATTYTFSGAAPTASADQVVLVAVLGGTETKTISSITVDGNAMTNVITSAGVETVAIYAYAGSTSTSGDVVVTWSGLQGRCGIGVYVMSNGSATATDTDTATASSGAVATSVNCNAKGAVLSIMGTRSGNDSDPAEHGWTNLTEDYDEQIESGNDTQVTAAHDEFASAQVGLAPTCTPNRTYVAARMVTAAFGPA